MIVKISLGLRKFRKHCENFANIAKISQTLRKFRNPSEIGNFRYIEKFRYPKNFAMIAKISLGLRKFRNHSENFAILEKLEIFAT